ncbi:Peroxiredoxin [Syntrophus gentianae]|uniref:Peroxiredoxin n=1 Tax=Syntrophus gentianae TaxID=43775 RepID=A0A1H7Z7J7_9BACT|nr:TlpA disulfide reductase family protein [Syntrophus gentianae]SEM53437.1 Peroxiredoxin [Syntrophus gentianae]
MKRFSTILGLVLAVTLAVMVKNACAVSPPQARGALPEFELAIPQDAAERNYLGLSRGLPFLGKGTFKMTQIKGDVVILEIFSMYCPYCQAEAPNVKALYEKIEKTASLRGRIKMIGIGAGNNAYEVDTFKKKYQIPFPLFSDGDFVLHKKFGEVRTPYFIVFQNYPNGSYRIVYSKLGAFGDVDTFLNLVIKLTGIQ